MGGGRKMFDTTIIYDPTQNIYPKINPVPIGNDEEDPIPYLDNPDPYLDDDDDDDD